jgi:hypothetical protein
MQASSTRPRGFALFPRVRFVRRLIADAVSTSFLPAVHQPLLNLAFVMKWAILGLAGALSLPSVSASDSLVLKAKSDLDLLPRYAASQPYVIRNATTPNLFSRFLHHFDLRQEVGRCGASAGGARCPNNQCCSTFDYCGTDPESVKSKLVSWKIH